MPNRSSSDSSCFPIEANQVAVANHQLASVGEVIAGGQSFPIPSSRGSGEQNADVYFAPLLWRVPVRDVNRYF
jgi:hypothetical protein